MLVAAIDVGSPAKTGWATNAGQTGCGNLSSLVEIVASEIRAGRQVALGFEAPCWVPRRRDFNRMTANRGGIEAQMSRPWSAGAGCGSLAAGIANASWFANSLHDACGQVDATTLVDRFKRDGSRLMLWEAFVSGTLKSDCHEGDAELAVGAFEASWPTFVSAVDSEESVNLLAATFLASGHLLAVDELGQAGIVVAAR